MIKDANKSDISRPDPNIYFTLELTDSVIYKAGELAEQYKLRGFDSIHMASVLTPAVVLAEEGSKEQLIVEKQP